MRRSVMSTGAAALTATAVLALAGAPALAAAPDNSPIAQATATAASVSVAGAGTDSGAYTSQIDSLGEHSSSGNNSPLITALGGQDFLSVGTLAQNATTSDPGGKGRSAACAGLAGDGATLVSAGDGDCLSGGDNLSLDASSLDLSNLRVLQSGLFQGIDEQLQNVPQVKQLQDQLTQALSDGLTQALDALGDPGLHLDLGAVQSHCTSDTNSASGDSSLANAGAWVNVPTVGRIDLLKLPVHPGPNTHVVTDLSDVVDALMKPLTTELNTTLPTAIDRLSNGAGTPLGNLLTQVSGGLTTVKQTLAQNVLDQVSTQLKPLQDNVLDITLNKQTRGDHSIEVTALDLSVLPAAKTFIGSDLAHLTVGTSACGPDRGVSAKTATAPPTTPSARKPPARAPEHVPTVVKAGYADVSDASSPLTAGRAAVLGLLVLAAGGAGALSYRRARR